jgi:hypothetical protein
MREYEMFVRANRLTLRGCMWRIGIFLVILLTLSACVPATPTLDVGDGGFLSGEPCGPPCFWGIVPGQTTETEVIEILREKGAFEVCEAFDREAQGGTRGIICPRFAVGFKRESNVIDDIVFRPSIAITAEEIITKYGEPELVEVGGLGVHVIRFELTMAYPSLSTWIGFPQQDELPYVLKPTTPVTGIVYDTDFGKSSYYEGNPRWQKWHGYGEYWEYAWEHDR